MSFYNSKKLREQIADAIEQAEALLARPNRAPEVLAAIDRLMGRDGAPGEIQNMQTQLLAAESAEKTFMSLAILNGGLPGSVRDLHDRGLLGDDPPPPQSLIPGHAPPATGAPATPGKWVDQHGRPVYMLARGQKWSDLPRTHDKRLEGVGIGDVIRSMITGRASPEIRAAMGEGANSTGGVMVPDELLSGLVDKARAASVIMQAGAQTVPMTSDHLRIARLASDATFEHKEENAAFVGSDLTFDSITFTTNTLGTVITASRELAEDAPNFASEVEGALVRAFAAKLDDVAINGMGSTRPDGILEWPSGTGLIGETGSIAAIAWEDLHAAVVAIQLLNYQPNAYVINPEIAGDLAILTSGDGTNSAKLWLPPPPTVAPLMSLPTTAIANDSVIVGDFSKFVWGVRHGAILETTREAAEAFEKHQFKIKLVWRGDCNATRRDAFHRLVGVTS